MLKWSEKFELLTKKGMTWKDIQEMDKGLEEEENTPKEEPPKEEPPKEEPPKEEPPKEDPPKEDPPKEDRQKLLDKIEELENELKEAQSKNVHGNNETPSVSFDEQLNEMFKDVRI